MTVLHPCHNCHRKAGCDLRRDILKNLRGLKITLARFSCYIPELDFPAGAVVDVSAFELVEGGYADDGYRKAKIVRRGVVRAWHDRKAIVVLDKDQEIQKPEGDAIGYLKVTSDRLTATGLPPVELCRCGLSQERCEANDYPSIRDGQFCCAENQMNYGSDGSGGW